MIDGPVLVVGGTGWLGGQVATELLKRGKQRFVLTSILTCDQTPQVPHFWHKKLVEDRLEKLGVPFVALPPGAFLDQITRFGGDPIKKGRFSWFGSPRVPLTFVHTAAWPGTSPMPLFGTGRYVADTTLQQQFFGVPPTAEDAVRRLITVR